MKRILRSKYGMELLAAAILVAMLIVPLCAWEAWVSLDEFVEARYMRAEQVHICEYCGSEVSE